jgi:hypothetical protein
MLLSPAATWTALFQDGYITLDMAWRWMSGQLPGRDYGSPLGIGYAFLLGVSGTLSGSPAGAALFAPSLFWLAFLPCFAFALRRRTRFSTALWLAIACAFTVVSPGHADRSDPFLVHLAPYNAQLSALLALCLVWGFPSVTRVSSSSIDRTEWLGDLLVCVWLIYAATSKATGAVGMALILLASSFCGGPSLRRTASVIGGALIATAVLCLATGTLGGYVSDLLGAVRARGSAADVDGLPGFAKLFRDISENAFGLFACFVASAALASSRIVGARGASAFCLTSSAILLAAANQSHVSSVPGFLFLALLAVTRLADVSVSLVPSATRSRAAAFAFLASAALLSWSSLTAALAEGTHVWLSGAAVSGGRDALLVDIPSKGGGESAFVRGYGYAASGAHGRTLAESLSADVFPGATMDDARKAGLSIGGRANAEILSDGLDALDRFAPVGSRVATLAFSNPFPALTGTPSPRGTMLWWHLGRTLGIAPPPNASVLFGDAEVVLEPRSYFDRRTLDALREAALPFLSSDFVLAGESGAWRVWLRRETLGVR